jgi:hypothetical protein
MRREWIISIFLLAVLVLLIGIGAGTCGGNGDESGAPPPGDEKEAIVTPTPTEFEVELVVDATNPEGVRFVAPGDGSYEITIISGATCHILETDPNWSEYGGWRTSVVLYINKPIEWGEPEENIQYGLVPVNFDYRLGEGKYVPTIEEAEATGIGSSVTLDLAKNDYIIALEHDHFDYFYDNSGTITLLITGYYQK